MRKLSHVTNKPVYVPKGRRPNAFVRLGKVHRAVFSPEGTRVVGFMVKRPDVIGMIKREDVFVALDALGDVNGGLGVTMGDEAFGAKACKRLGIEWDRCVMWAGMDAKTSEGKVLGYVGDATYDAKTGEVGDFLVGDGGMAESLVGSLRIPASMLVGYERGYMVLAPGAADQQLTGGVAAKAGEASARAKAAGTKAAEATGRAVDKGSRALGKQIGRTKGMFGAFMDEYRKASH